MNLVFTIAVILCPALASASTPDELANLLIQAKTAAEQNQLLADHKSEINAALLKALFDAGDALRTKSQYPDAIAVYQVAETVAGKLGDRSGTAHAWNSIGTIYQMQGDYDRSIEILKRALDLARELNNPVEISEALIHLGSIAMFQSKYSESLEYATSAYQIKQILSDKPGMAMALNTMGNVEHAQGHYDQSLKYHQEALSLRREAGTPQQVAASLNNIANVYYDQGNYSSAIDNYQQSLQVFEKVGDKKRTGIVLHNIGGVYRDWGDYRSALDYYQRSLALQTEIGDLEGQALSVAHIGAMYSFLGNFTLALKYLTQGLALNQKMEDQSGAADAACEIGELYSTEGNYNLAAQYLNECESLNRATGYSQISRALLDLGELYSRQGNQTLALDYYEKAKSLAESQQKKGLVVQVLLSRGNSYFRSGQLDLAAKDYATVLAGAKELSDKPSIAATQNSLGNVELAQHNYDQALSDFQASLSLEEEMQTPDGIADVLNSMAAAYLGKQDYAKAIETGGRALEIARNIGLPEEVWKALTVQGRSESALKQSEQAMKSYERAIAVIEDLRSHVAGNEEQQERFFEDKLAPYHEMISELARQNRDVEAFQYAERAKSRVLDDILRHGKFNISKRMTDQEREQEEQHSEEMVSLNAQIRTESLSAHPDNTRLTGLNQALEKARISYEDFQNALYVKYPDLQAARGELKPAEIADASGLIGDHQAILEYVVTDDKTFLFAIRTDSGGDPKLASFEIAISRKDLAAQSEQFRDLLSKRDPGFLSPSEALYERLVGPARSFLKGITGLILVPDAELWGLPFQALADSRGKYLLEDYALSYVPSVTAYTEIRKLQPNKPAGGDTLLAFGNPLLSEGEVARAGAVYRDQNLAPLPEAETEVRELGRLYGKDQSKIFVGGAATESEWKNDAGKFEILHLATHGILNNASPLYSHIVLSENPGDKKEDGLLEVREIMQQSLSAKIVVLSACETALGRVGRGEGMIGLSWAFFVSGSAATVVSQWKVESTSTSQLMLNFHRNLRQHLSKTVALQRASKTILMNPKYRHPFYWAGFVVIGDPS